MLLMRTRLGAERGKLAPQTAGRRLIDMSHRQGCPCCGLSATDLPRGESEEHYLVECTTFKGARAETGLQAIIDELRATDTI